MLSVEQRKWRADKIADLANIAAGVLIFGQFASNQFSPWLTLAGLLLLLSAYYYSDSLLKRLD